jgi:hypothetical protein
MKVRVSTGIGLWTGMYDTMQCVALQQGNEALSEARHELRRVF